jgi:hypothetical protein
MHILECVELASWLRLSVSTLNIVVKKHEEIERSYFQCGPLSKQHKSMKLSFATAETGICTSCMVQEAVENNASIHDTHLKKALSITACLGIANTLDSAGCINRFKRRHNIVYRTLSGDSRSVDP